MSANAFGKRIQELRLAKNISQRELATKADMDFTYLSKIENGRMPAPRKDVIERLAKELDGDLNELMVLGGMTTPGIEQAVQKSESARRFLFRHAAHLSDAEWEELLKKYEKDKAK